jgi:WD40 repeat protein
MIAHQGGEDTFSADNIKIALKQFKRLEELGSGPLADLSIVRQHLVDHQRTDSVRARGLSLKEILLEGIKELAPYSEEPRFDGKKELYKPEYQTPNWRSHIILSDKYIKNRTPEHIYATLGIKERTYESAIANAYTELAEWLYRQEDKKRYFSHINLPHIPVLSPHISPELEFVYMGHTYHVNTVAISHNAKWLLSGGGDHYAIVWNLETNEIHRVYRHKSWVGSVSFSPDDKYFVTSDGRGNLRLFTLETEEPILIKEGAHTGACRTVLFNRKGEILFSAGEDGEIKVWSFPELMPLDTFFQTKFEIRRLALLEDNNFLLSGDMGGVINIWNIKKRLNHLVDRISPLVVRSVASSSRGYIAVATGFSQVIVYKLKSGQEIDRTWYISAHKGNVVGLAFHPETEILATSGQDRRICLWDLTTRKLINILNGHSNTVTSLAFSPTGNYLISGSRDELVCKWTLSNLMY